jgi:hypothetical protein
MAEKIQFRRSSGTIYWPDAVATSSHFVEMIEYGCRRWRSLRVRAMGTQTDIESGGVLLQTVGDVATQIDVEIGRASSMSSEYEMGVFGDGSRVWENYKRVEDNQEHLSHLLENGVERMAGGGTRRNTI